MVLRSYNFNDVTNMNTKRNAHGDQWSPCAFRRAGHDKRYMALRPCRTHDARTAEKPVRHHDFPTVALYDLKGGATTPRGFGPDSIAKTDSMLDCVLILTHALDF